MIFFLLKGVKAVYIANGISTASHSIGIHDTFYVWP